MAAFISKPCIFIAFLWLLHLSLINGMCLDRYPSVIWKGPCFNYAHCDIQCRLKEGAVEGECGDSFKCLCTYAYDHFNEKPSGTFRGLCSSDVSCSRQCRAKENAFTGHCYYFNCFCSYP